MFRNSPGGKHHLVTGIFLAINHRGLRVEIEGTCALACANVFLFSKNRGLSPKADLDTTYLLLHGSYHSRTLKLGGEPDLEETRAETLLDRTGLRFRKELFLRALHTPSQRGGLFIFMKPHGHPNGLVQVFFCEGSDWLKPYSCEVVPGETPTSLGVIDLPPK